MRINKGDIYIFLAAFIWGFCLVGQASGMEYMGPLSFTGVRLMLGAVSMVPLILAVDYTKKKKDSNFSTMEEMKKAFVPGLICSPFFISPIFCQQIGLQYTSVGKCAFITALYIFLVPLLGSLVGKRVAKRTWFLVILAVAGLYLITMSSGIDGINKGDLICMGAAITYTVQLLLVEKFGQGDSIDGIKFSTVQFFCGAIIALVMALIFEPGQITWYNCSHSIWPIFVTGVISCAVGYTLQFLGFLKTESSRAAIILSSETVFSLLAGWMLLHEVLTPLEYLGCAMMAVAIILNVKTEGN